MRSIISVSESNPGELNTASACAISCLGYNSNSAMRDKQIKTMLKVIPKSAVLSPGMTFSVTTAGLEDYT